MAASPAILIGQTEFFSYIGITSFDYIENDTNLFGVMEKCGFHRINSDLFQIADGQAILFGGDFHLACHIGLTHQSIVGTEEHPEVVSKEHDERMTGIICSGTGAHITC